jgi:MFS family permease
MATIATQQVRAVAPPETRPAIDSPIDRSFLLAYAANLTLVIANACLFVFAEWVRWVATQPDSGVTYREEIPGSIVQAGLFAAMTARLFLGRAIDRFGVRRVWAAACLLSIAGETGFLLIRSWTPLIYVSRMAFATGVAAMFTCSAFHMMSQVADHRRTEFLALLGSSGFLGMIIGPQLASLLQSLSNDDPTKYFPALMATVLVLNVLSLLLVGVLTRSAFRPCPHLPRPSLLKLMMRYWPGMTVLVGLVMGSTFTVVSVFLVRFANHQGLNGIAWFWTCYAVIAFATRLKCATLTRQYGRYKVLLWGMVLQAFGMWALMLVTVNWHVIGAATLGGMGHALLFPSLVSLGSGRFPAEYRGSGTNLTLGFVDLGAAISAPVLGWIIDLPAFGGAGFRQMFFIAGCLPFAVAIAWYFHCGSRRDDQEMGSP